MEQKISSEKENFRKEKFKKLDNFKTKNHIAGPTVYTLNITNTPLIELLDKN